LSATASFSSCPQQTKRKEEQKDTRLNFKKEATKKKKKHNTEAAYWNKVTE